MPSLSLFMAQPKACVSAMTPSTPGQACEGRAAIAIGDGARHRRRAVHGGQDADVVARRDAAVGPADAVEGAQPLAPAPSRRPCAGIPAPATACGIPALCTWTWAPAAIGAVRDGDEVGVLDDRLAHGDRLQRELVADGNVLADHDAFGRLARRERRQRDRDVVAGMKAQGALQDCLHPY